MTPRLTETECDICGKKVYAGRHGDPLCTDTCAALRSYRRTRDCETRAGMRELLADSRTLDPDARMRVSRHGIYIDARIHGRRVRIEAREDLDWIAMDLDRSAA